MSGYSEGGAGYKRPALKSWSPLHLSSKSDLDYNIDVLRNRAADLVMNSPLGAAAIQTMTTGTLSTGLKLFPTPKFKELGLSAEAAREWARRVKLEFEMWAQSLDSDFNMRNNFMELQRLIFQSYLTEGDCFVLLKRRAGSRYTLKLQAIEAARISNPNSSFNLTESMYGNNKIVNGIEVDRSGRLQAAWISNRLWNEIEVAPAKLEWQRVKFFGQNGNRNILHICYDTRPGMFRGAPLLSPVIETLKQVTRYSDAELTSAIIKSFFSLFFIQPASNLDMKGILPQEDLDITQYKLGSGTLSALPRGVDVKAIEHNNAQSTFDPFISHFTRQIGAALNIPFEVLTKNFQSSYSASRAALIEAEKEFRQRRAAFVLDFCAPVYENWLIEAVATEKIEAPHFFDNEMTRYLWSRADWRTEVAPAIDPVKDANAAKLRLEMGISTREIECIRNGEDYWDIREQLKFEN